MMIKNLFKKKTSTFYVVKWGDVFAQCGGWLKVFTTEQEATEFKEQMEQQASEEQMPIEFFVDTITQ